MRRDAVTVADAQQELRQAYVNAGPGTMVSGIVWVIAGFVLSAEGLRAGFAALFFGGFLIYPFGLLICRVLLRATGEQKGNPLAAVVPEGLPIMLALLFAAWTLIPYAPDLVIPIAVIAIATHYFPFQSAYGLKTFWLLGAVTTALGFGAIYGPIPNGAPLMWIMGALEVAFGIYLALKNRA